MNKCPKCNSLLREDRDDDGNIKICDNCGYKVNFLRMESVSVIPGHMWDTFINDIFGNGPKTYTRIPKEK